MLDIPDHVGVSADRSHVESASAEAAISISPKKEVLVRTALSATRKNVFYALWSFIKYHNIRSLFDPVWYLSTYDDVLQSRQDPWIHYCRFGIDELRQPNPYFSPIWYIDKYPDISLSQMDPLSHYVQFGAAEGRDPHRQFSTNGYLGQNPDVKASGINALAHFIRFGVHEGRSPISAELANIDKEEHVFPCDEPTISFVDEAADEEKITFDGFIEPFALPKFNLSKLNFRQVPRLPSHLPRLFLVISSSCELATARLLKIVNFFVRPSDKIIILTDFNQHVWTDDRLSTMRPEAFCRPDFCDSTAIEPGYLFFVSDEQKIDFNVLLKLFLQMDSTGRKFGYADECYSKGTLKGPFYKPDWDPALLIGQDYIGRAALIDVAEANRCGWFESAWAPNFPDRFALKNRERLTEENVEHIPEILAISPFEHTDGVLPNRKLRHALIANNDTARNFKKLLRNPPRTEIIIPTRDGFGILKTCIESIVKKTRFNGDYNITIVNNQSKDFLTIDYLEKCKCNGIKVIDFDESFNYSKMNNVAAADSNADCFLFLNNDVEVITPSWLKRMVAFASLPDVGAVGAKLLYPDGRVQHAGVVLGPGHSAMHVLRLSGKKDPGYAWQLARNRSYLAVTAACMAISRSKFSEVGGFDETNLPVAYNDVDLCLKLYMSGYSNLWLSGVKLYHHESISRGADTTLEKRKRAEGELKYMWKTWSALYEHDPFHNSNILYSWGPNVAVRTNQI